MSGVSLTELARRPLRVVGDVHGDLRALEHALATERFVIQLGDLVDGPAAGRAEGMAALERMIVRTEEGRGLFLLGNHEYRLARTLQGLGRRAATETAPPPVPEARRARLLAALSAAPAWLRLGALFFVHAAFHPAMLATPPPHPVSFRRAALDPLLATALYGGVEGPGAGRYPRRSRAWVGLVPPGLTVYVGHDSAFTGNAHRLRRNEQGGEVIFLDTGAGKGGHLSWLDLDPPFG